MILRIIIAATSLVAALLLVLVLKRKKEPFEEGNPWLNYERVQKEQKYLFPKDEEHFRYIRKKNSK
jgi:hypothetical protein